MASLQARHQKNCKLFPWTTYDDAVIKTIDAAGDTVRCSCKPAPMYYVVLRHDGKLVREAVGHNREEATRALNVRLGEVAKDEYRVVQNITFEAWGEEWLAGFTGAQANTGRVYSTTIDYATRAFGKQLVRKLQPSDVRRFLKLIEDTNARDADEENGIEAREVSSATLRKHLAALGSCLEAAVPEYASSNPVRTTKNKPKVGKPKPSYYTDAELARLWPELAGRPWALALCKTAVTSGLRFGELAALRWSDVDLLNRELRVQRQYVTGLGEKPSTKSGEARTVDLSPQAAAILEDWFTVSGGDGPMFVREDRRRIDSPYVLKHVLYPALDRAGIPRVGEGGRERTFHSFRHTFARITLEGGAEITWVKEQLGHSSIDLTVNTYGRWSRKAQKAQAEKLEGVFPV